MTVIYHLFQSIDLAPGRRPLTYPPSSAANNNLHSLLSFRLPAELRQHPFQSPNPLRNPALEP